MGAMPQRVTRIAAWIAAALGMLAIGLAAFPWGLVARHAAAPLSRMLGRPVTIGGARRIDWIGFVPEIELRDLRVGQPAWAGPGDMARVARLGLRLPVLPLLFGHVRPRAITVEGLALHLVRDASGRDNWSSGKPSGGGSGGPRLADLTIRDGRLRLDDAKRHVVLNATLVSDRTRGLRIEGAGTLRGSPLRLAMAAPAIGSADPSQPYPATLTVRSPLVSVDAQVRMDHPLDTGHFSAKLATSGHDLGYLDDLLQAGLFRTQPFRLSAEVRHDGEGWRIPAIGGTIGRTDFKAALDVAKADGRTKLTGQVDARTLDFDDFSSDEQRAQGAAESSRRGPRAIPSTRIVLDKLDKLDGRITLKAAKLLSAGSSPFRAVAGTVSLDHRLLTVAPVTVALPRGTMTGSAAVDGRSGTSRWALDLRIGGATIDSFFPDQQVFAGPLAARVRLNGSGATLDEAVARGRGRIALVVDGGSMRRDYATFLGGDLLKSVGAAVKGKSARTSLQCLVGDFTIGGGRLTPAPLVLSTPVARGDGQGSVALPSEAIDLRIVGRPTKAGLLQSTAPVRLFGTLSQPKIDIRPPRARDAKESGLLARVGFFVKKLHVRGDAEAATAAPVSCEALTRTALR